MARGRFDHTMDGKGRVSVPQGLRDELSDPDGRPLVLTNLIDVPAVGIYSHESWVEFERRLASMSQAQPEVQAFRRMLVGGAVDCPIDGQGRIVVPQHLRQHAGLEREVVLTGIGTRVELWDRARYEQELQATRDRGPEVAAIMANLGF